MRRSEARPFTTWLGGAFRYPLYPGGLLSILGLAVVCRLLQFFGGLGAFLASGVYWGFLFGVIVATWKGQQALEPPDFSDVLDDLILPALRGLVAGAIVIVPFVVRAILLFSDFVTRQGPAPQAPGEAFLRTLAGDPIIWLLLLASVAYLPAALIAASVGRSLLAMLNPLVPIQMARILGSDYAVAAIAIAALGVAGRLTELMAGAALGRIPVAGGVLAFAIAAYLPIVGARILGLLVYVRGDDLGLGQEADHLDPLLPGATPRGGKVDLEPAPRRPRSEAPQGPASVARAVSVRAAPEEEPVLDTVPVERPAGDPLEAALAAGDLAQAFALYRERQGAKGSLTASQLFQVARGAAQAADYPVAAHALHAAASEEADPVAPDALLVLGRLYRGKLGRPDAARQAFEALLARYPGTAAAAQATTELAKGA